MENPAFGRLRPISRIAAQVINGRVSDRSIMLKKLFAPENLLNSLLVFAPIAVILEYTHANSIVIFAASGLAIIALMALHKGLFDVVKASLTGSIIGNILLVLGLSVLAGGMKYPKQVFNKTAAMIGSTMLGLSAIALLMPAVFHIIVRGKANVQEQDLS